MGLLGKASDNFDGIMDGISDFLETQRSIENNKALKTMAYGSPSKINGIEQMLLAEQQAQILESQRKDATRRYNILKDPELNRQIQAKRIEILEKTGSAVSVDDIIDIYFNHLNENGLTDEEEDELAFLQAKAEAEEEAKIDAEIAEQKREAQEHKNKQQTKSQFSLNTLKNTLLIIFATLLLSVVFLVLLLTIFR